mmetsp:Transcript_28545/g.42186  ORF Transcript_28545/g.42186 Transcript_28545/m.42186 type:complete len:634 (-) Transcript_28545:294-2195(-)|eukprot:CAMPEP_0194217006 /NCGR_PEP_ID=MMETSP0156-20130528/20138_1 /TAXON_ID=33649 /ORGANISM="Thalassionema nitzschioides, Strain L26-B" /LENGTH=633 /DNA_ID=CAMNT_0038945915 /DNA_START=65 /DNA_END=1966 /DNA_ORIENTATION=-
MSAPQCLHIAGWTTCGFYSRAASVIGSLSILFPNRLKVVHHAFPDRTAYRQWLVEGGFRDKVKDARATTHSSSPFVWLSKSTTEEEEPSAEDVLKFVGGHDDTLTWCRSFASPGDDNVAEMAPCMKDDGHTSDHEYDYDLVVIGGGSGGMAAGKEAAEHGAKVACLDFVKPSPAGTSWGLGGTCVNVGCIPKKLMHAGALLQQSVQTDLEAFGIELPNKGEVSEMEAETNGESSSPSSTVKWETLRENVQNYIRGLNFKYRVAFREKEVTYLNKLAKFVDKNTIEATDKKGRTSTITASRFLIAVGGRPAPLAHCEGGELVISSDDIFAMEKNPGKTLCVGASYISLECAGFLAGYGNDVTVAVRSILLRGFDREVVDRIGAYMEDHGVKFRKEVTPVKLEKLEESGQIQVTFSDGSVDSYDTVLAAVGRHADTAALNLEAVDVAFNPKNGKILTEFEQSSTPNIYAVGDVMEGCPELTPVAIQAGQLLARRLFASDNEPMDYVNICTTVFTPIEYACVGYSEEDALENVGANNLEVYIREFLPLEWSLPAGRSHHNAFTKVLVDKTSDKVVGIHFLGPNAGEVMQGYGAAMKNGLTYSTLKKTVGIHPTSSEEIVTIAITKSSGEDAAAGGC